MGYAEKPNLGEERDILYDLGQPVPSLRGILGAFDGKKTEV